MPEPLPLPPPPTGAHLDNLTIHRRRRRRPPPHHHHSTTSSSVPFSWERIPGIPKDNKSIVPIAAGDHQHLLPLPPSRHSKNTSKPMQKWRFTVRNVVSGAGAGSDPFVAALEECAKADSEEMEVLLGNSGVDVSPVTISRRRRPTTVVDRFGLLDLYGSCKTAISVSESTVRIGSMAGSARRQVRSVDK